MSDTPKTDAAADSCHGMPPEFSPRKFVSAEFAKDLEREIHRLKRICENAHDRLLRGASPAAVMNILDQALTKEDRLKKTREALLPILKSLGFTSFEEFAAEYAKTQREMKRKKKK